ncbi:hypothetical protein EHP00_1634 [Ecytonucleospora hepatopenaei]|uniref:Uncharacterized protein n=1 Tax=Ecytonucleospora hepatopenaei TaxID=646526 RepID=A0A1W0E3J6_9MICR|nr:hypothetical protein EHP00_1634 [Ecytonucleospora hepatopenaei]
MHFLKYILRANTALDFCRQDIMAAEQCLSNPCERYNPQPPYCPVPYVERPCVPSEAANQALRELELLLKEFTPSLLGYVNREIHRAFNELYTELLLADARADDEIFHLAHQLEREILEVVSIRLKEFGFSLATSIRNGFAKSRVAGAAALAAAKVDIAAVITALSALTDAEILANLQDKTNGFQAQAISAARGISAATIASLQKQEKDILSKISQGIANEKAFLTNSIAKFFKDFDKGAKAVYANYNAVTRKLIENAKIYLENEISRIIAYKTRRDGMMAVGILRRLIQTETGCNYVEGSIPINLLINQPQFQRQHQITV